MPAGSLIDRVLDILDLLADFPQGMPLSDIARRLKLPKSEAHRVLAALVKRDFAAQDELTQRYRLSVRAAAIGSRFFGRAGLDELCQPILDRLAARTGELVRLTMLDAFSLIWVAKAQGAPTGLRYDPESGLSPSLHATANGRAWLASLDEDDAVALVKSRGFILPPGHVRSIVNDEATLRDELRRTRERGHGHASEEAVRGIAAVAVAVRDRAGGPAVGTVSVAGPVFRMTEPRIAEIMPDIHAAASDLSEIWPLSRSSPDRAIARRRA